MTGPVIAIGLDATDPVLLEGWMDRGLLPNLAALRAKGSYGWVRNMEYYRTETSWITFLTGATPHRTGEWGHVLYDPLNYAAREGPAYRFVRHPPFYALLPGMRTAVFDPPLTRPVEGVDGVQVTGWGTEVNQCLRVSRPPELMGEILRRYGSHPLFELAPGPGRKAGTADEGEIITYRIPCAYDVPALHALSRRLQQGAKRRGAIMRDLLGRGPWDCFLGVFSETHTASHLLWHLSQPHPLRDLLVREGDPDPALQVFQAVDAALGEVLADLPSEACVVVFSIYGIAANCLDLPSMLFLPELLYRWNFPGRRGLAAGDGTRHPPPPRTDYRGHWKDTVWGLRTREGEADLESPDAQEQKGEPLHWLPVNWYRRLWPGMRAFALPTYSEGLIRINVRGRDGAGLVEPGDYGRTCDELCDLLAGLTDARTGRPMVRDIVRPRSHPLEADPQGPPADLIVLWQEEAPTDVVESPVAGRIGPAPYFRSGGHVSRGVALVTGPGIPPGGLPEGQAPDLTATLVALLGRDLPGVLEGTPLLRRP